MFCQSDTSTNSERFYESVLDFLNDPDEEDEVGDLLNWWNCSTYACFACECLCSHFYSQVFPSYITRERGGVTKQSALAMLKEKRARLKQIRHQGAS